MHENSMTEMNRFIRRFVKKGDSILDVGSAIVLNQIMSYRQLVPEGCSYAGLDIQPLDNVDIVAEREYDWPLPPDSYDIVLCGQMLEHVKFPWLIMQEIARVLKPGGYCCLIAPSVWPIHNFPIDTYRYNPAGMEALGEWAKLEKIDVYSKGTEPYIDCIGIFRKTNGK